MIDAAGCQRLTERKTVDSLGFKAVLREALISGIRPWRASILLYLSEPDLATDYIRIMGPILLNDSLSKTVTFRINRLTHDETTRSFNISKRVLESFPLTIVVSREKVSDEAIRALHILKREYPATRIWIDIDDDLFSITEAHPEYDQYASRLSKLRALIDLANTITVSTDGVERGLLQAGYEEKQVAVIPNYLDDRIWQLEPTQRQTGDSSKIRILYSGTETHDADLKAVVGAIQSAQETIQEKLGKDLEVTVFGGTTADIPGLTIVRVPDSKRFYARYVPWLQGKGPFDFAIAPLDLNNRLNKSKSALKYLEYSAMGLPAIFTEIEPYVQVIDDHENGILVPENSQEMWVEALVSLATDSQLAQRLSGRCHADVINRYLLSRHFGEWKTIIEPK